jgi:hypothetical protein
MMRDLECTDRERDDPCTAADAVAFNLCVIVVCACVLAYLLPALVAS